MAEKDFYELDYIIEINEKTLEEYSRHTRKLLKASYITELETAFKKG